MDIYYKFLDSDDYRGYVLLCPKEDFDKTSRIEDTDNYKKMRNLLEDNKILKQNNFLGEFEAKNILKQYRYNYEFNYEGDSVKINDEKEFLEADDELFNESVLDKIKALKLDLNFIKNNDLTWTNTLDEKDKTYYYILNIEDYCPTLRIGTHTLNSKTDFDMDYFRADIGRIVRINTYETNNNEFIVSDECNSSGIEMIIDEIQYILYNKMGKIKFEKIDKEPFFTTSLSKEDIEKIIKNFI